MDSRSWPWKKKSSDNTTTEKRVDASDSVGASLASVGSLRDQENYKKVNYVQISLDSYTHLAGLEDQVNTLEDQVKVLQYQIKDLNEKLSAAYLEMTAKDNLVKQHAKVAEEAVSGWEKADTEALALKNQLESVTLLKLTAEDRASHLDGALKECMRQIRIVKEENEQKLHEVILTKTKQWDNIKLELEAKIADLDQKLLRSDAENAALARSLQEHSNMLTNINKEKSQAEFENDLLKGNIQAYEKEINSLKYELHVVSKELDIRNQERNMNIKSAEAANKQHLEGMKKIAKLEAECQRLRSLVRKKLPGPAALSQMKHEVENLGRNFGEPQPQRSPLTNTKILLASQPGFSADNLQPCHKETEFLTTRFLAMEEETKMLKEALAARNRELLSSRDVCAKMVGRLKNLEAQIKILNQRRSSPKSIFEIPIEGSSSQNASNSQSVASMSEDGFDKDGNSAKSWVTASISDLSHLRKDKNTDKWNKPVNTNSLELMDDFLEMERLACFASDSDKVSNHAGTEAANDEAPVDGEKVEDLPDSKMHSRMNPLANQVPSIVEDSAKRLEPDMDQSLSTMLLSRIIMIFESQTKGTDIRKVLEDLKHAMMDIQNALPQLSLGSILKEYCPDDVSQTLWAWSPDNEETTKNNNSLIQGSKSGTDIVHTTDHELVDAVSHIHQFVLSLDSKVKQVHCTFTIENGLTKELEGFSASVDNFLLNKISLINFVLNLSCVLARASDLKFCVLGHYDQEREITSPDFMDKVALLENKVVKEDLSGQNFPDGCSHIPNSTSDHEVPQKEFSHPGFVTNDASCKCLLEELEQLKIEKDSMAMELARCTQDNETTNLQLQEMEQLLAELKSELASSQRLNGLAETQLKCMAESYKSLEMHTQELEAKVNHLRVEADNLDNMLQEEKHNHQDTLTRCNDLEEQMQRKESCSMCSISPTVEFDIKTKQEGEIAAAAVKLAECQETIYLLGRQLKALCPQGDITGSQGGEKLQTGESSVKDKPSHALWNQQGICGSHELV
ncbi:hypothetical protein F0562_006892 [Nyssa sinensis]|uniref:Filament-like plant protein 4 n=1 Tax=Nyssa sinensis TaxID=561372 RepID=A0A5J5AQA2_9ASTE|nr:hypothetical protein F0562_006892 [Nyssa sinensis]